MKRILGMALLLLAISFHAFADSTDKATLGGMSTTNGIYDWRVDSNGNFIPGTTAQNNIGSASNQVAAAYIVTITGSGVATLTNLTVTNAAVLNGGINWDAIKTNTGKGINWTDAFISTSGVNWESVRMLSTPGNNSSGTNWQAFGV